MLGGLPVKALLERFADAEPVPGGGAAAALSGAVGAALLAMVCRISANRSGAPLEQAAREAEEIRDGLTALMDRDATAFRRFLEAGRLPADRRQAARQETLVGAIEAPVTVVRHAARIVALGEVIAPVARPSTLSDLGTAVTLAMAAVEAAVLITRANLAACDDAAFARATTAEAGRLCETAAVARRRTMETILRAAARDIHTSRRRTNAGSP